VREASDPIPPAMHAMVFHGVGRPLEQTEVPVPEPGPDQALIRVEACAVCRTDLHVLAGDLSNPKLPLIPGHEVVGTVAATGSRVEEPRVGERVGVPWLGATCGDCEFCRQGLENLCGEALFTGYTLDGGYAEFLVANWRFCLPVPSGYDPVQAAPLLCAGLIGYRSLRMTGEAARLGIYGFGAAAHIVAQVARHQGRSVFAFTRPGDRAAQDFARLVGVDWAGSSEEGAPEKLDAAIIFAPVGSLVPRALREVRRGGVVVCGGIHMSEIPAFPYELLWGERQLVSVANLTREDGLEFMRIAPLVPVRTRTRTYPLSEANRALAELCDGQLQGAAVLVPEGFLR
jgi:alcohol dehydrogenase, propanol-preferring